MSHPEFSIIENSGFFTVDFAKEGMGGQTRYCLTKNEENSAGGNVQWTFIVVNR